MRRTLRVGRRAAKWTLFGVGWLSSSELAYHHLADDGEAKELGSDWERIQVALGPISVLAWLVAGLWRDLPRVAYYRGATAE